MEVGLGPILLGEFQDEESFLRRFGERLNHWTPSFEKRGDGFSPGVRHR